MNEKLTIKTTKSDGTSNAIEVVNSIGKRVLTITDQGRVGIGTKGAGIQLRKDTIKKGLDLWVDNNSGGVYIDSQYDAGDSATRGFFFRTRTAGTPVDVMRIEQNGNVGIGTNSPELNLHVMGPDGNNEGTPAFGSDDVVVFQNNNVSGDNTNINIISGTSGTSALYFGDANDRDAGTILYDNNNDELKLRTNGANDRVTIDSGGNVGIGTASPNQQLTIEGTLDLKEQADANADTAGYGQIWVHNTTPNELWFTDDAGTDTQLSSHPLDAPIGLYTNGAGIDWIGKRVQKYQGKIYWQTLDGKITIETFEEYNARRKNEPGHINLIKKEWDEDYREKAIIKYQKEEVEVSLDDAIEEVEVNKDVTKIEIINKYVLDEKTGKIKFIEEKKPIKIKQGTGKFKKQLKQGIRLDSNNGKLYRKKTRAEAEMMVKQNDIPKQNLLII